MYFNEKFLDDINTEKAAYFLGLMYSDGSINSKQNWFKFGQIEPRKELVFLVRELLDSEHKINVENKDLNNFYVLKIYSKYFVDKLKNFGCIDNKTFKVKFPKFFKTAISYPDWVRRNAC